MKRLISLSEIRQISARGEKILYVDGNTLVTPAARDAAAEAGLQLVQGATPAPVQPKQAPVVQPMGMTGAVDIAMITRLVIEALAGNAKQEAIPAFEKEVDAGGLLLIRGNTVKCEPFDTGNPRAVVGLTDIVSTRESPNMGAGFMTIEKSAFDWTLNYEEFDVILEGTLDITVNGRTYSGKAGDVFFIPKGTKITWSTPDFARYFYSTYPANWADLV